MFLMRTLHTFRPTFYSTWSVRQKKTWPCSTPTIPITWQYAIRTSTSTQLNAWSNKWYKKSTGVTFPGGKTTAVWNWPLTFIWLVYLHGLMLRHRDTFMSPCYIFKKIYELMLGYGWDKQHACEKWEMRTKFR